MGISAPELHAPVSYAAVSNVTGVPPRGVRETTPTGPPKPRLLDRVRLALRARHGSRRTEKTYVAWVRRYVLFHGKRHRAEMGAAEITQFLSSLAVETNVAASTQNPALSALLFLYPNVLEQELPWLDGVVRAKRAARLPVVLTREEVRAILRELHGPPAGITKTRRGGYHRSAYRGNDAPGAACQRRVGPDDAGRTTCSTVMR